MYSVHNTNKPYLYQNSTYPISYSEKIINYYECDIENHIMCWVKDGEPDGFNNRLLAWEKIEKCIKEKNKELFLTDLELTYLPRNLPEHITKLFITGNKIIKLPTILPEGIEEIHAQGNKIKRIPNIIPKSLRYFNLNKNSLDYIHNAYRKVILSNENNEWDIDDNPLTQRNIEELDTLDKPNEYNGPNLLVDRDSKRRELHIKECIEPFITTEHKEIILNIWCKLEKEYMESKNRSDSHALQSFKKFLENLHKSVERKTSRIIYDTMEIIIDNCTENKHFRNKIFKIAEDTMKNCYPKEIDGFINMNESLLAMRIFFGFYDDELNDNQNNDNGFNEILTYVNRLYIIKSIYNISLLDDSIYKKDCKYIVNHMSTFYFLCERYLLPIGVNEESENLIINNNIDIKRVDEIIDENISAEKMKIFFLNSKSFQLFSLHHYPKLKTNYNNYKVESEFNYKLKKLIEEKVKELNDGVKDEKKINTNDIINDIDTYAALGNKANEIMKSNYRINLFLDLFEFHKEKYKNKKTQPPVLNATIWMAQYGI